MSPANSKLECKKMLITLSESFQVLGEKQSAFYIRKLRGNGRRNS